MHVDFTLKVYQQLVQSLIAKGYGFQTFHEHMTVPLKKAVILRHDVDLLPYNSSRMAQLENQLGVAGTYYFRVVRESFDENIIRKISALGHEIGYHYEEIDTISRRYPKTDAGGREPDDNMISEAYRLFCDNLKRFNNILPVYTICMHGSPRSRYDNKMIWKNFSYRELGIIGEPYLDLDFNEILYLTDTGRRWDGGGVSVRDKVSSGFNYKFRSTYDIIKFLEGEDLPEKIMITLHPQRWTDSPTLWLKEICMQNAKNIIKGFIVRRSGNM